MDDSSPSNNAKSTINSQNSVKGNDLERGHESSKMVDEQPHHFDTRTTILLVDKINIFELQDCLQYNIDHPLAIVDVMRTENENWARFKYPYILPNGNTLQLKEIDVVQVYSARLKPRLANYHVGSIVPMRVRVLNSCDIGATFG